MTFRQRTLPLTAGVCAALLPSSENADDPCAGFSWNVAAERALFAGVAQALTAGHDAATAPAIETGRLYELALAPHQQVQLPAPNRRADGTDSGAAGLVRLKISSAGAYRISVGAQLWVDVGSGSMLIASSDFAGQHGCDAPHKIVQFHLQPGIFVLQLAGAASEHVKLTVTRAP